MKKLLIVSLLARLFLSDALAQGDSVFVESVSPFTFEEMTDSIFKHVDLGQVPTGILIEKSLSTLPITLFNGTSLDSNQSNLFLWRRAYGTLKRASVDTAIAHDTTELYHLVDTMQSYLDSGYIPVSIINMNYNSIRVDAFEEHLLSMSGLEMYDVEERENSPYEENTCFIAAAATLQTDTTAVNFIFPEHLYISNDERDVDHIEVDFNDGQGWQMVSLGSVVPVLFPEAGVVDVIVKVILEDMEERISHFYLEVQDGVYMFGPSVLGKYDEHYFIEADEAYEPVDGPQVTGAAHVFIHYGCNSDKKLRRPFIMAGGFSTPKASGQSFYNRSVPTGKDYFATIGEVDLGVFNSIVSQGYDLVFVVFFRPFDYIQSNALVLEKIIKLVNEEKASNGSLSKNVLLGTSMGGIVARYALGDMHAKHIADPGDNPDHDTRLYYSHDSPHLGVNVPLAMQALTKTMYNLYFVHNQSVSHVELEDVLWDYLALTCPAGQQMLINNINTNSLHTDFYDELKAIGDFDDLGCKAIAISNGSGWGVNQGTLAGGIWYTLTPGALTLSSYYTIGTSRIAFASYYFQMWAVPEGVNPAQKRVFESAIINRINNQVFYPYYVWSNATQWNGLDSKPGSLGNGYLTTGNILSNYADKKTVPWFLQNHIPTVTVYFPYQCFIPTISAVDVDDNHDDDYDLEVSDDGTVSSNNRQYALFKRFITTDDITVPPLRNAIHCEFTPYSASVFNNEMLDMIPNPTTIAAGKTYNYGEPVSDWIGSGTLTIDGTLAVNKDTKAGYSDDPTNNNSNPPANSLYRVETIKHNLCFAAAATIINVNGTLQLGDGTGSRSGELHINNGSKLVLKAGSHFEMYENSRLVIKEGATLEVEDGADLNLNGNDCVIEIQGTLKLNGSTTMALSNGSGFNGYLKFSKTTPGSSNPRIAAAGSGAILTITGSNTSDKIMEVAAGTTVETSSGSFTQLDEIDIQNGIIEMGTDANINLYPKIDLQDLVFNRTGSADNYVHNGITINTSDGDDVVIRHCDFNNAKTGIRRPSGSFSNKIEIGDCFFNVCQKAIHTTEMNVKLKFIKFTTCSIGWKAEDMEDMCEFTGIATSNTTAIDFDGDNNAKLLVYNSNFSSNGLAISHNADNYLALSCNQFISNIADVLKIDGEVKIAGGNITMLDGINTRTPGSNLFQNASNYSISLDVADIALSGGANNFIYSSLPTNKIILGSLAASISTLPKGGNLYSINSASDLTTSDINIGGVTGVSGSPLGSNTLSCAFWTGSHMDNTAYDGAPTRELPAGIKKIKSMHAVSIYPNPAGNQLNVAIIGNTNGTCELEAVDMTGRAVSLKQVAQTGENKFVYDLSSLASGIYQILVKENGINIYREKLSVIK